MISSPQYFDITIEKIINETPVIRTCILKKPKNFNNLPGQFCWLSLPSLRNDSNFPKTPMAVGSGTHEKELLFSFRNWGYLTGKFFELHKGDSLSISKPLGTSVPFNLFKDKNVLCIAGGTGIVPIRSLIASLKFSKRVKLFYGARNPSELLYKNEIKKWNTEVIVEQSENSKWNGPLGYVTKLITQEIINEYHYCYVCGPIPMMQNTISLLRNIGFPPEKLFVSIEKMEHEEVIGPVFPSSDSNVTF